MLNAEAGSGSNQSDGGTSYANPAQMRPNLIAEVRAKVAKCLVGAQTVPARPKTTSESHRGRCHLIAGVGVKRLCPLDLGADTDSDSSPTYPPSTRHSHRANSFPSPGSARALKWRIQNTGTEETPSRAGRSNTDEPQRWADIPEAN